MTPTPFISTSWIRLLFAFNLSILTLAIGAQAWETEQEAASQLVDLLTSPKNFGVTTLSTLYPSDHQDESLRGLIASGAEYFAAGCFDGSGDLLMLGMPVSQNWRNVLPPSKNPSATLSINSNPDPKSPDPRHLSKHSHNLSSTSSSWDPERPSWRKGMPSKIRTQLIGSFEIINKAKFQEGLGWIEVKESSSNSYSYEKQTSENFKAQTLQQIFSFANLDSRSKSILESKFFNSDRSRSDETKESTKNVLTPTETETHSPISKCYLSQHPDSSHWTPGASDSPHQSMWVRFKVEKIYSVGGFGDEHRIGYLRKEVWEDAWRENRGTSIF